VAHAMAVESPRVASDVVEIREFPHLARTYRVMSVPTIVINDKLQFTGGVSEEVLLRRVMEALGEEPPDNGEGEAPGQTTPIG